MSVTQLCHHNKINFSKAGKPSIIIINIHTSNIHILNIHTCIVQDLTQVFCDSLNDPSKMNLVLNKKNKTLCLINYSD